MTFAASVLEHGFDGGAENGGRRPAVDIQIDRFVNMPARLGEFPGDRFLQPLARRRRVALQQETQPLAAGGPRLFRQVLQKIKGAGGCGVVAAACETARAVGIVQIQNRRLGPPVRAAVAAGEERVALQLDRPAFVRSREQRHRPAARRHGRRIILRGAVNVVVRLLRERFKVFLGPPAAAAGKAHARQQERGGHDLDKMTPLKPDPSIRWRPAGTRAPAIGGTRAPRTLHPGCASSGGRSLRLECWADLGSLGRADIESLNR